MRKLVKLCWVGLLSLSSLLAFAAEDFELDAQPVFQGAYDSNGIVPLQLVVRSLRTEPGAVLAVETNRGTWSYPVDLRAGRSTSLLSSPVLNGALVNLKLTTSRGETRTTVSLGGGAWGAALAVIANHPSRWNFLNPPERPLANQDFQSPKGAFCKPAKAPDRSMAYYSFKAIVLGDGAESLSDAQVRAIQQYALLGGQVVACAGDSDVVVTDKRWAGWFDVGPYTLKRQQPGQLFKLTSRTSDLRQVLLAVSPSGKVELNKVTTRGRGIAKFIGWHVTDPTLKDWSYVEPSFRDQLKISDARIEGSSDSEIITGILDRHRGETQTVPGVADSQASDNNPFQTKLPKPTSIFGLMAGFFLVVIPINFLVLRFFKRAEWAWFTAPVLSILFATAVFSLARGLYSAKQSRAVRGVVIAQAGVPQSIFVGRSELFFPKSGTYDLGTRGIEGVVPERFYYNDSQRGHGQNTRFIEAHDAGELTMPKLKVPNLAFREIDFVQKLEQAEWVRFEATVKPKRLVLKVTNVSNHLLQGARLNLDGENWSLGDLKPGEEIEVKRYLPPQQKLDSGLYSPEGSKRLIPTNVAHFEASVRDLTPGPTVGNLVEQRSWVDLEVNSQPLGISAKGGR